MATLLRRLEGAGVEVTEDTRALARSSLADNGGHIGRALNQALRKLPSEEGGTVAMDAQREWVRSEETKP